MTDRKLTDSTAITGIQVDPANDLLMVVDVSDTTDAASGTNKKITVGPEFLKLFRSYFRNEADTITSILSNTNTSARTYTFQDRDGTIADTFIEKARGSTRDRYIIAGPIAGAVAASALAANQLRAHPFIARFPMTIDKIVGELTVGTTGNWRIGIYADDGSGYPGSLVVDSGEFTVTAPGVFSSSININLLPGLYWLAYLTNTANTARVIQFGFLDSVLCFPSTIGGAIGSCWTVAESYKALPDPFTNGGVVQGSTSPPIIAMRIV